MKTLFLVTGATGHIGSVIVGKLVGRGERVRALVLPSEREFAPEGAEICLGDVTDTRSLALFFDRSGFDRVSLIHCAALITIASKPDPKVWEVNVTGTKNVMRLALETGVDRAVYLSSVHAIPEKPGEIAEVDSFSPGLVYGQYAKSKAAAAQIVLDAARDGLNVSIVHPSGVIGPGDARGKNHMIRTIRAMARGRILVSPKGGYDFVDSRDVADGVLACERLGRRGECYILSGHYISVRDLLNAVRRFMGRRPLRAVISAGTAKLIAPLAERLGLAFGREPPLLTPCSAYTLNSNGRFSHEKATRELGYRPRDILVSIRDSLPPRPRFPRFGFPVET
ncbi:MAG: NAD-dependent epimerase/dehydratase family protein [Oscillospiraceae bacterium]|nr:NAD-dependent epimerase/dehydratase family protein [Oscillospiraceae bacterium]